MDGTIGWGQHRVVRARRGTAEARISELEAAVASLAAERDAAVQSRDVLAAELASAHERMLAAERERDRLVQAHERLRVELELLKRRLTVAKAERVDTTQLELEFAEKLRELEGIAGTLGMKESSDDPEQPQKKRKKKPSGRRDLADLNLPEERVEITDPEMERLVAEGKATRHGVEESRRLMHQKAGLRCVVIERVKYRLFDEGAGRTTVVTAEQPPDLLERSIFTPSLAANVIHEKVDKSLTLYRIEEDFRRRGVSLDRATMCRRLEDLGATFGATVLHEARLEAMSRAFCIATDATGFKIQPGRHGTSERRPCKRGHFLVLIADRDHVFFEYMERETSEAIAKIFEGFTGHIQADAKGTYDILFRAGPPPSPDEPPREAAREVGCWSHMRRYFWEATAISKSEIAREGLARIGRVFELERLWAHHDPVKRKRLREAHLRAHVESFFEWNNHQAALIEEPGYVRRALQYTQRHEAAFKRFLDNGRLVLDNNRSERALRKIAVGRKNWLFAGSDLHASSLGHLLSLNASARLHGLDPEAYFRDLIRVLPFWPRGRYLELCPRDWPATRAKLDPQQLAAEVGWLDVPDVSR